MNSHRNRPQEDVDYNLPQAIYGVGLTTVGQASTRLKKTVEISLKSIDWRDGYAVVDLEMTGPDPLSDLIIEIAVGILLPGKQLVTHRVLVKVDRPLPKSIISLTGITDRDLALGGVKIDDALAWFVHKTSDLPLVGHSILDSDRPFLVEAARRHRSAVEQGLCATLSIEEDTHLPAERFIDTAGLYKGYKLGEYQQVGESHQAYVERVLALRTYGLRTGLTAACDDLGISTSRVRAHRAAGDVLQNHKLFEKLLELNSP